MFWSLNKKSKVDLGNFLYRYRYILYFLYRLWHLANQKLLYLRFVFFNLLKKKTIVNLLCSSEIKPVFLEGFLCLVKLSVTQPIKLLSNQADKYLGAATV